MKKAQPESRRWENCRWFGCYNQTETPRADYCKQHFDWMREVVAKHDRCGPR